MVARSFAVLCLSLQIILSIVFYAEAQQKKPHCGKFSLNLHFLTPRTFKHATLQNEKERKTADGVTDFYS